MRIAVVTGNPKPGSRTQGVALAVADALAAELAGAGQPASPSSAGAQRPADLSPAVPPPAVPSPAASASPLDAGATAADATPSLPYVPIVPAVGGVPAVPPPVIDPAPDPVPPPASVPPSPVPPSPVPPSPVPAGPVPPSPAPAFSGTGPQRPPYLVIDLAEHAAHLFEPSAAELSRLSAEVAAADIVIFASPTYKASYTGMLKAFLDRYGNNGLAGTVAVPVMTGGWPGHLLAVEVHLRPVLVELGATVPARGLYVTEPEFATLDAAIAAWAKTAVPLIRRAVTPG